MNLLLILRAAEDKNADQLFAYIDEYRKENDPTVQHFYGLNLLALDYENGEIDDAELCEGAMLILDDRPVGHRAPQGSDQPISPTR